jgi:homoserine O-acetyltransferase
VVSFTTDWRFSPQRSREIVNALIGANKQVSYAEVESEYGHDAFLIPIERYYTLFQRYMSNIAREIQGQSL